MNFSRNLIPAALVITLGAGLACQKPEAEIKKEAAAAYDQGMQAFKEGKTRESNPYLNKKSMDHAAKAWNEGWDAAKAAKDKEEADRKAAEEEARRKAAEEEARRKAAAEAEEAARRKAQEEAAKLAAFKAAADAALKNINFDFDKSFIREADKAKLQAIADFMKANAQVKLQIEGHCDERGTEQYNMSLGERRAHAALKYLIGLGIAETRFTTISYGKERPKVQGHNEESWLANRRCEFKMTQQ